MLALTMLSLVAVIAVHCLLSGLADMFARKSYARSLDADHDCAALGDWDMAFCADDKVVVSTTQTTRCLVGYMPCCEDLRDVFVSNYLTNLGLVFDPRCAAWRWCGRFVSRRDVKLYENQARGQYDRLAPSPVCDDLATFQTRRLTTAYEALSWILDDGAAFDLAESMALSDLSADGLATWLDDATALQMWSGWRARPTT
jgi:hypothetical protein